MSEPCIFCRIVRGEVPAQMLASNKEIAAFRDLNPQAPVHILIVTKKHIASLDDMADPLGGCVGQHDRVESDAVAPVGRDHGRVRAAELIEPEQLTDIVGSAWISPPPLHIGGFVQAFRGVSPADSTKQFRRGLHVLKADEMLFAH